jgi:hypothetical protein
MKPFFKKLHIFLVLTILSACGSGNGTEKSTTSTSGASGVNGIITVRDYALGDKGTITLSISKGTVTDSYKVIGNAGDRPNSTRHPSGKIVYRERCNLGDSLSPVRISVYDEITGKKTNATPCSNKISKPINSKRYEVAKLSPDESKVAVSVWHIDAELEAIYSVLVFDVESNEVVANYFGYKDFEWLPRTGQLLLLPFAAKLGYGIFITDSDLQTPRRIDNQINQYISQPDISPSGNQLLFIQNKQIYMSNIDGTGLKRLIKSRYALSAPTWSPDNKYIAYLDDNDLYGEDFDKIFIYELSSGEIFEVSLENWLSEKYTSDAAWPMSWTK